MRVTPLALAALAALSFASARADAQFFRNQGIAIVGSYLGLGSLDYAINGGRAAVNDEDDGWNIWDQPGAGIGYFRAIGYQAYFESAAVIGASTTVTSNSPSGQPVLTLGISTGIRYNFLEERVRPFVAAHLHYLQLIALAGEGVIAEIPGNEFLGNTPFFIGLRPGVGVEWVFGDEQALLFELGGAGFLVPDQQRGIGSLFLPATSARLAYLIYF